MPYIALHSVIASVFRIRKGFFWNCVLVPGSTHFFRG